MAEPRWLVAARRYVGTKEVRGSKHNPLILKWWQAIRAPFTDDETPWCAGFVGGCLEEVGIKSSRSASARSYERWGVALNKPAIGCVVVFSRRGGGHVGFCVGHSKNTVAVLGGNQRDMVNITNFEKIGGSLKVTAYRWPEGEKLPWAAKEGELDDAPEGGPVTLMGQADDPGIEDEAEERPGLFSKIRNWAAGSSIFGFLTYLTDWQMALVAFGVFVGVSLFLLALAVWLFGKDGVRRWVRKQVL